MKSYPPTFSTAIIGTGLIFFLRVFAAMSLLPLIAVYGQKYLQSTDLNIGVALGIYGLSQALLQIPYGFISDIKGRRRIVIFGLIISSIGSFIAAAANHIYVLIIGRFIQGSGAIGSTLMAWFADITDNQKRAQGMAILGLIIALAFSISIALGPLVASYLGIRGLFVLTGVLYLIAALVTNLVLPEPEKSTRHDLNHQTTGRLVRPLLKDRQMQMFLIAIFLLHVVHTEFFYLFPIKTAHLFSDQLHGHWTVYSLSLLLAFAMAYPLIGLAEARQKHRLLLLIGWACVSASVLSLSLFHDNIIMVSVLTTLFFLGFILIEALLPSIVSRYAPAGTRGTAMGLFSSCQFAGIFFGGLLAGLNSTTPSEKPYGIGILMVFGVGFWALSKIKNHHYSQHVRYAWLKEYHEYGKQLIPSILTLEGVSEATWSSEEYTFYLKVDKRRFDVHALRKHLDDYAQQIKGAG